MSLTEFAKAMKVGRNTIIKNENGERQPKDHEIEKMAAISGFPVAFFTADLEEVLGTRAPGTVDRVDEISSRLAVIEQTLSSRGFLDLFPLPGGRDGAKGEQAGRTPPRKAGQRDRAGGEGR